MELNIHFDEQQSLTYLANDVAESLHKSFGKFERHIRSVSVTVRDVNGPKGGIDKQCRCVLHLKKMAPIVIQDRDASFVNLLTRVSNRAAHTLRQRIDRRQMSFRTRKRQVAADDLQTSTQLFPTSQNYAPLCESTITPNDN